MKSKKPKRPVLRELRRQVRNEFIGSSIDQVLPGFGLVAIAFMKALGVDITIGEEGPPAARSLDNIQDVKESDYTVETKKEGS